MTTVARDVCVGHDVLLVAITDTTASGMYVDGVSTLLLLVHHHAVLPVLLHCYRVIPEGPPAARVGYKCPSICTASSSWGRGRQ